MTATVYDDRPCELGEGPFWHPNRKQLFWFDIMGKRLLLAWDGKTRDWQFDEHVSACGWVSNSTLLVASESQLLTFNIRNGAQDKVCDLEADNPLTRSNDGRADPMGGFWIGTMSKTHDPQGGAIYRYYKGELRSLFTKVSIPNAICFAPDGSRAYFTDTITRRIMSQELDSNGWPKGEPKVLIDLRAEGLNPDGSVTDAQGNIWNAQWGASRIAQYSPDGTFLQALDCPALHASCPCIGGDELDQMFCTTAREGLDASFVEDHPNNGKTFLLDADVKGWAEPQVLL